MDVLTALIVDRDELLLVRGAELFRAHGMQVRVAGEIATLARVLGAEPIDVVVAGMELRDAPAEEILRTVRAHDDELPVIFVAAWPDFTHGPARDGLRATVVGAATGYRRSRRSPRKGE